MKNIFDFLKTCELSWEASEIRWRISKDDSIFFNKCVEILLEYEVSNLLDISCGLGNFVKLCNSSGIKAYGIDPVKNENENIYLGTFSSIIKSQEKLNKQKFDCITIHNTLHGKYHSCEELFELFQFLKNHCRYLVISDPSCPGLLDGLEMIYAFDGSHADKSVIHKLYKI